MTNSRTDAQAAQISVATLNSQGGKFTIPDVMLKWGEQEEVANLESSIQDYPLRD
ncbi:phage tail assembly protein T [Escherichia coli]